MVDVLGTAERQFRFSIISCPFVNMHTLAYLMIVYIFCASFRAQDGYPQKIKSLLLLQDSFE